MAAPYGQILDCDAHFYLSPDALRDLLGDMCEGDWVLSGLERQLADPGYEAARSSAHDDVWAVKGIAALGSTDAPGRLEAMQKMGVARQLLFPNTSLRELRYLTPRAQQAMRNYNDIALEWSASTGHRARVVCQVNTTEHDAALREARRVIAAGAKAILVPCAEPPAGVSPAHPIWDDLWELAQESDTPIVLHAGGGGLLDAADDDPFFFPRGFADSPTLKATFASAPGNEERIGPVFISTCHMAPELYVTMLVTGGVFERFPRLRFGIIEFGAQWFGPMAERLDANAGLMARVNRALPLSPSEYLARNVRITPVFRERVDRHIDRYGLADCYVFASDYPHLEGGRDPISRLCENLPASYVEDFFVNNATLLLPG